MDMANWQTVREYIAGNYTIKEDTGDLLTLGFTLQNGRTHMVLVGLLGNDIVGEWASIEAPIGKVNEVDLNAALASVSEKVVGGLSATGEWLVVRDTFPLADLSVGELEMPLQLVLTIADELEGNLLGVDNF